MKADDYLTEVEARTADCQSYNFGLRNADTLAHEDAPRMAAALRAVLDLHKPADVDPSNEWCVSDEETYPCPTVRAITEKLGVDE